MGTDPTRRNKWWGMYCKLTAKWQPAVLLGDFKAKFAPNPSSGASTVPPPIAPADQDDDDATQLRPTLAANDLQALDTIPTHSPTRALINGITAQRRLDYNAVTADWATAPNSPYIGYCCDSATKTKTIIQSNLRHYHQCHPTQYYRHPQTPL